MAKHELVGESPFLKRVLIPFWVVRILVMIVEIGAYGLVLGAAASYKDELDDALFNAGYDDSGRTTTTIIAVAATIMVLILVCLILDIVCIVKRSRRNLSPKFFLIVNVVQTLFWTVMFILSMLGVERQALAIILSLIVYLSFLGLLIYASIIFHRHRKGTLRGAYAPALNPALAEQGLAYNPHTAAAVGSYPSYPVHAAYGEPVKPSHYEMTTPEPQQYGYAPQTQGYPAQTQQYAAHQQHTYPQYGHTS